MSSVQKLAPLERASVLYSTDPEDAGLLGQRISMATGVDVIHSRFSAVMGAHLGPRALGVALTRRA